MESSFQRMKFEISRSASYTEDKAAKPLSYEAEGFIRTNIGSEWNLYWAFRDKSTHRIAGERIIS